MLGATALEQEVKGVLQAWEWWCLKVSPSVTTPWGTPCTMAKLMATQSPSPSSFVSRHLCRYHMDQEMLQSLWGDMLKAQENHLVCLCCWLLLFVFVNFRAFSFNFCRFILTPATFNTIYIH